jgi:FdrA protein
MIVRNEVRRATYLDSIVLMRLSRQVAVLPGVVEAGLFIGTPANKEILRAADLLAPEGEGADAGDLILAIRAGDAATADAALAETRRLIDRPANAGAPAASDAPRTIRAALQAMPDANLALISVPGHFAAAEARKAMALGLNVMIFSDNVPLAEEAALKREGQKRGLLVMGPDCGTAIIAGLPLAFANMVPRGDIGIVGASGTGIQEVSCLIARAGRGISHAIGTGGRDLKAEVSAITTLMAIGALDGDEATKHIVLISKPPDEAIARRVLDRVALSAKPFTICFLGAGKTAVPANARIATTLKEAAELALGHPLPHCDLPSTGTREGVVRGLFAGGTFCAEAQFVFLRAGLAVASNVPVPGAGGVERGGHVMLDLGDDAFTRGRPHPMIDAAVRDAALAATLADPAVAVVLVDVVLGLGAHRDPAGHLAAALEGRDGGTLVLSSVTGTDADPQNRAEQVRKLTAAGVVVAGSNADAAAAAIAALSRQAARRALAVRP